MSGKEVFERLGAKHKVAHNTLLTVLDRLIAKGLVMKKREGKNNLYSAKLTRDEFASKIASPIIEALLDVSSNAAISAFIKTAQRDPAKLDELKKLIMEAEKKASDKSKEKKKK
jgi:predicted transcriptional regulator